MGWRLVEPCCGSAALTLHLLGARRALVPYQGSKWRFRLALVQALGVDGSPGSVELWDPGPWGIAAPTVVRPADRAAVIARLQELASTDPRQVYERLNGHPASDDPVGFATEFLFLQRLSFSGKAVGLRDGKWSSPGFNSSSAYGLAATDRFGPVSPMVPSLVRALRGFGDLGAALELSGGRRAAAGPGGPVGQRTVVYLDPPYAGSTAYPNGDLDRAGVLALARSWAAAGAAVFVSEAEPLAELVAEGWTATCLTTGRADTSRFRGQQAEWLTCRTP